MQLKAHSSSIYKRQLGRSEPTPGLQSQCESMPLLTGLLLNAQAPTRGPDAWPKCALLGLYPSVLPSGCQHVQVLDHVASLCTERRSTSSHHHPIPPAASGEPDQPPPGLFPLVPRALQAFLRSPPSTSLDHFPDGRPFGLVTVSPQTCSDRSRH